MRKQLYLTAVSALFTIGTSKPAQNSPSDYAKQQAIKQGVMVIGKQTNDLIDFGKQKAGLLTPFEESQLRLNASQEELNNKQKVLAEKQSQEADLDIHLKKLAVTKETCAALPKNDPVAIEQIERLKLKMLEFNKDLPELQKKEEPIKTDTNDEKTTETQEKVSLFAKLATPFVVAAAKTGHLADFFADYSFAYVTNLEYFKDTFVGNNAQTINRALVIATISGLLYAIYKYKSAHNGDDEDIFYEE
jgi:hypothetical protein